MNYWQKRQLEQRDLLYDKTLAEYEAELKKQYQQALKAVSRDIEQLYDEIIITSGNDIRDILVQNCVAYLPPKLLEMN